ncbi:MAG: carbohydrate-binding family 9-like protein [Terriglobales bacterium]
MSSGTVSAVRIAHEISLDARHPALEWANAAPLSFCADWRGENADPSRQTEVRLLWTPATLYLRFACRYRELFVFEDSDANGRRDHLWDRDVAEAFLQPDPSRPRYYKEFEVSPNGMWIDLDIVSRDIAPGDNVQQGLRDLRSGLTRAVWLDPEKRTWAAELAIPMTALTADFDPAVVWRANFYRVEGPRKPRFYSAWQPTNTPQPDFHVPAAFGKLCFTER